MIRQNNLETSDRLVGKVVSNFTLAMLCLCIAYFTAQGENTNDGYTNSIAAETTFVDDEGNASYCKKPTFHPCKDKSVLDFERHGYKWPVNSTNGTYTVGDQTFEININDPDGIFGALHQPVDPDDLGSYESDKGIAVGINPYHRDDEIEIVYKLSKVSDKVAFTIRDLDKKYYQGSSKQIEKVCIYGYCDGEPVTPIITSLCGSVKVKDNCAVATTDSYKSKKDESIRVVFDKCIDEIKIVYGNAYNAPQNPSYSKIYIGDDIGFGTALCHSKCKKCTVEPSCVSSADFAGCTIVRTNPGETVPVSVNLSDPGSGDNSRWVITDESNIIVEVSEQLPVSLTEGIYNFYYINWDGELSAPLNVGANLINIINNSECAALGKPTCVEVETRCAVEPSCTSSGDLAGNCGILCAGPDGTRPVSVSLDDAGNGDNSKWVITDQSNSIIEVTDNLPIVLAEGKYNFYYINWNGELSAPLNVGANLVNIINNSECAALGKPVCLEVKDCCTAESSFISTNAYGDELCTTIPATVFISGGSGDNSILIITDASGIILSTLPSTTNPIPPLEFLEPGTYLVWHLNWEDNLSGQLLPGANLQNIVDNSFCAALSNSLQFTIRDCCTASSATISLDGGGETLDVCVNDETLQLANTNFVLNNAGNGDNTLWIITDENGIVTSIFNDAPSLNLYAAQLGTMQIWYLNWDGSLSAIPAIGSNLEQIVENSECAALSNPVVIVKECCCPYSLDIKGEVVCIGNEIALSASLIVDENLILDNETIVCEIDGFRRCSVEPIIFDQNGNKVEGPIDPNTPDVFTVTVDECRCAPDLKFTLDELVLTACGAGLPVAPIPQVINVTENSVTISCQHEEPTIIEFRKSGDITFSSYNPEEGNDMLFLTGLESCTSYEYRSRVVDANGNSATCPIQTLTTDGCRNINIENINLTSLNVSATTAVLTWDNMPGSVYTFYYRIKGKEQWKSYDTSIPYLVLFGLTPCTDYEWAIRISEDELVSEISSIQLISTTCEGPRLSNPNVEDVEIGDLRDLQNIELDLFVSPGSETLLVNYRGLPMKSIGIYNANGQLVKSLNINNNDLSTIDVSNLKTGIYILASNFDGGVAKNKFLINK